jgi:hypothetical protein
MVFRIRDIDWSEASGERIELGLGTFRSLDFHQRCRFEPFRSIRAYGVVSR